MPNALNAMKMIAYQIQGADRKHLKWLSDRLKKELRGNIIHRATKIKYNPSLSSIRFIIEATYTNSIQSVYVESNIPPLNLRKFLLSIIKLSYRQQIPYLSLHLYICKFVVEYATQRKKSKIQTS